MADEEKTVDPLGSAELFKSATTDPVEPEAETPPEATQPEAAATAQPAAPPAPPPPTEASEATIPSWRLREEAEARRLAEQRAQALEARLNEVAQHIRGTQKSQPDFFENPDAATQALIQRTLQPFAEEQRRNMMYLGKMVASATHGQAKVDEAEQAFLQAREREQLDPADYERVVQSPNRYDAVVHWHNRQNTLTKVGNDPEAWFEKQLEARMADPQFQAKLLEKVQGEAAKRPSVTKIPPSLSKTTASASNRSGPDGDLSDASLFAYAMGPKPRYGSARDGHDHTK